MALFGMFGRRPPPKMAGNAPYFVGGGFGDESTLPDPQQARPQGPGTGRMIAGTIGDFLQRLGGGQGTFQPQLLQHQRRLMEQEQHQRELEDSQAQWVARQEYEQAHPNAPTPTEFERSMVAAGILPGTPEYATLSRQRANNLANPMIGVDVQRPDGSTVREWVRPGQQAGQQAPQRPLTTEELDALEHGGPRPQASGRFPLTIDRNNNPGALRVPGSTRFQSFQTPAAGIRAQEAQLRRYHGRGLRTVSDIVETYAPRRSRGGDNTDEQVNNYIAHVSRRLGIRPGQPIPVERIPEVANAMRGFETGRR